MVLYDNFMQYYYDIFHIAMLTNVSKVIVRADRLLIYLKLITTKRKI